MNAFASILFVLLALCSYGNSQAFVVTLVKSERNASDGRPSAEFKVNVPNDTIAVVSVIPIMWMDRKKAEDVQDFESRSLMLSAGTYKIAVVLTEVNPLIVEPLRSRISVSVETKDTVSSIYLDTILPINRIKFSATDAVSGTFDMQIADKDVPVFQIKTYPNPTIRTDPERRAIDSKKDEVPKGKQ